MLILGRCVGEQLYIGDEIVITICGIKGQQVRVGIDAPKNIRVMRSELREPAEPKKDPTP